MMKMLLVTMMAMVLSCTADIAEDFEGGMGTKWSSWSDDNGGHWLWRNASQMDVPQRPSGDSGIVMVFIDEGHTTAAAHLYSPLVNFAAGSKLKMSFWIRSQYAGATNLILKSVIHGAEQNPGFLDVSHFGTPDSNQWREAEADVPITGEGRICIFGFQHDHELDAIAVDDLVIVGVDGTETRVPLLPTRA